MDGETEVWSAADAFPAVEILQEMRAKGILTAKQQLLLVVSRTSHDLGSPGGSPEANPRRHAGTSGDTPQCPWATTIPTITPSRE
jgi:hypothetical protein